MCKVGRNGRRTPLLGVRAGRALRVARGAVAFLSSLKRLGDRQPDPPSLMGASLTAYAGFGSRHQREVLAASEVAREVLEERRSVLGSMSGPARIVENRAREEMIQTGVPRVALLAKLDPQPPVDRAPYPWRGTPRPSLLRQAAIRSDTAPVASPARMHRHSDVTALLKAWRGGDQTALERLTPLGYDHLRRLGRRYIRKERGRPRGCDVARARRVRAAGGRPHGGLAGPRALFRGLLDDHAANSRRCRARPRLREARRRPPKG
jgi:hypothetical protein